MMLNSDGIGFIMDLPSVPVQDISQIGITNWIVAFVIMFFALIVLFMLVSSYKNNKNMISKVEKGFDKLISAIEELNKGIPNMVARINEATMENTRHLEQIITELSNIKSDIKEMDYKITYCEIRLKNREVVKNEK